MKQTAVRKTFRKTIFEIDMSPERKMPRSRSMARGDTLHRTLNVIRLLELNPRGLSVKQIEDRLKADEHIREVCSMGNEVIAIGRHENDVSSTKDELVK